MQGTENKEIIEESRVAEDPKEQKVFSRGLIISIVLSIISVTIFTWLIFSLYNPTIKYPVLYYTVKIVDENFFRRIVNTEEISPGQWINPIVEYKVGFYIMLPIALICFVISGLTVLVRGFKRTKLLIFVNWFLYSIPIISSFFVDQYSYIIQFGAFAGLDVPAIALFKFFYLINIPLHISMLLFQEDFHKWILSPKGQTQKETANNFRTVTFLMFYILTNLTLIVLMIDYNFTFTFGVLLGLGLSLLSFWWVVGDSIRLIILMNKRKEEDEFSKSKLNSLGISSIVIGAVVLIANVVIGIVTTFCYIPIVFFFSCLFLIIGVALGSLVSSSIVGKIGYSINAFCLLAVTILFIILASFMGYTDLFV